MSTSPAAPPRRVAKRWLFVTVLLVGAVTAWLVWRPRESALDARGEVEHGSVARATAAELATPTLADVANDGASDMAQAPTAERAPVRSQRVWRLRGRLELVDFAGNPLPPEAGELEIIGWTPRRSERFTTAVDEQGRWAAELEFSAAVRDISIGDVRLRRGPSTQLLEPLGRMYPPDDGELVVGCRVWPRGALRVVDRTTREDLHDVYLQANLDSRLSDSLDARGGPWFESPQRSRELSIADGLSSPIDLPSLVARIEELGATKVRVVARGHEWGSFDVAQALASVVTLELKQAGELVVTLGGFDTEDGAAHAAARLRQSGVSAAAGVFDERGRIEWSGLRPGAYELALFRLRAQPRSVPARFDLEAQRVELVMFVDVRAGESQSLQLSLGPSAGEVAVSGRLYAPDTEDFRGLRGWRLVYRTASGELRARSVDSERADVSDRPGLARLDWTAVAPRSGPFELQLRSPPTSLLYSGPDDPRLVAGVELAPLVELLVTVVDAESGARWRGIEMDPPITLRPAHAVSGLPDVAPLAWSAELSAFVAFAQPGRYVLAFHDEPDHPLSQTVELSAPRTEVRLAWRRGE
jgi:hypothetical protein